MDLMYGKIGMLEFANGKADRRRPIAGVYERMANFLEGVFRVTRIDCPERPSIYLFQVERRGREPGIVVWERRDPFSGEESPATPVHFAWGKSGAKAVDVQGQPVRVKIREGEVYLVVSDTPIYMEEDEVNSL